MISTALSGRPDGDCDGIPNACDNCPVSVRANSARRDGLGNVSRRPTALVTLAASLMTALPVEGERRDGELRAMGLDQDDDEAEGCDCGVTTP